jgi:hypothetical protein
MLRTQASHKNRWRPYGQRSTLVRNPLEEAGVLLSAGVLEPPSNSTTVTRRTGALQVQDGPFADTKEQLAGSSMIEGSDLDAAITWAGECPDAQYGTIEIRPSAIIFHAGEWHVVT